MLQQTRYHLDPSNNVINLYTKSFTFNYEFNFLNNLNFYPMPNRYNKTQHCYIHKKSKTKSPL